MINLSFVGSPAGLMEYLAFCQWAELDAIRNGRKVIKIFSDLSGYVSEINN